MISNTSFQVFSEVNKIGSKSQKRSSKTFRRNLLAIAGVLLITSGAFFLGASSTTTKNPASHLRRPQKAHKRTGYNGAPNKLINGLKRLSHLPTSFQHNQGIPLPQDALTVMVYVGKLEEFGGFTPSTEPITGAIRVRFVDFHDLRRVDRDNNKFYPTQRSKIIQQESFNALIKDEEVLEALNDDGHNQAFLEICVKGKVLPGYEIKGETCFPLSGHKWNYQGKGFAYGDAIMVVLSLRKTESGVFRPLASVGAFLPYEKFND